MHKGRIALISIASVMIAGALTVSLYCKSKAAGLSRPVDIEDALVGKTPSAGDELYLRFSSAEMFQISDDLWTYELPETDQGYSVVPIISEVSLERRSMFFAAVSDCDPGMPETIALGYREYYQSILERLIAKKEEVLSEDPEADVTKIDGYIDQMTGYISDEVFEQDKSYVTSYKLTVTAVPDYALTGYISGVAAVLAGILLLYSVLGIWISGKKLAIGSLAFIVLAVVFGSLVFRKEIATMASIRRYSPDLYLCNVTNDYKLDEFLSSGISDSDTLIEEACKRLLGGIPLRIDAHHFGCSSFSCITEEGTHLLGRNFDSPETNGMLVYSNQEGSYASIAVCDLRWVKMAGDDVITEPDSLFGRLVLRGACAIMCVDGFNDQGLGISILSLDYREERKDTGKPDTLDLLTIRAILDRCANTDEALALLSSYDVHSMYDKDFHLFITDKTGNSVIAEWVDDELTVTRTDHVTNYVIATHEWDDERRFVALQDKLEDAGGVLSVDEALDLLTEASQNSDDIQTEWSCVYDLDHFVLYIYSDLDRDNVQIITPETFGIKEN